MTAPYIRLPFISHSQDKLCQQRYEDYSGYPGIQYSGQYHSMPQHYPPQSSYDTYTDSDTYVTQDEYRQPQPQLSNNPATANITLFKELTGYPNYGNPSRNADILYTGNRGTWTFDSPAFLLVPGNQRSRIVIRAVLDDHYNVPVNRYSARITFNGSVIFNGRLQLPHGSPAGGMFTNWRDLTFNIPNLRRNNRVVIENTSSTAAEDWIAIDWMEIRLLQR